MAGLLDIRQDLETEISETGLLRTAIEAKIAVTDAAHLDESIAAESAEKEDFFARELASHKRRSSSDKQAMEITEALWARRLEHQK